jgi:hypothetical protein
VRAAAFAYFFAIAALGFLAVRASYRLRVRYGHPYLSAWTLYVGSWSVLALLAVVRYVLIAVFLPPSAQDLAGMAGIPLAVVAMGAALYFLASFLGQIVRRPPSKIYRAAYVAACGPAVVLIVIRSEGGPKAERGFGIAVSIMGLLLKNATAYGWMILTLVRTRAAVTAGAGFEVMIGSGPVVEAPPVAARRDHVHRRQAAVGQACGYLTAVAVDDNVARLTDSGARLGAKPPRVVSSDAPDVGDAVANPQTSLCGWASGTDLADNTVGVGSVACVRVVAYLHDAEDLQQTDQRRCHADTETSDGKCHERSLTW